MTSALRRTWLVAALATGCVFSEPDRVEEAPPSGPNSADSAWSTVTAAADATLLEAPARVILPPDAVAEIAATYRFHVDRVAVRPGDIVAPGDVLVEGTAPDLLDATATMRASGRRIEILGERRERLVELRREGLVEQSRVFDLDVAIAEVEAQRMQAAATLRAAGYGTGEAAKLSKSGKVSIVSPIAGIVRAVDAVVGQVREPSAEPMVSIVGDGDPRIEARLPGPVPPGVRFELVVRNDQIVDLGDAPPTTVVVPEDGTTLAWWDPPGEDLHLSPGLQGRVLGRAVDPDLRQIPASALRITEGRAAVLRAAEGGETEVVPVEVVAKSGTSAIVRGPLQIGDRVAADASRVLAREPEAAG